MNNNNYTPFVEFVKEKEQTEFFFQLGLYIRPYHGFQLSGTCTCGNEDCTTPGKHPVFNNLYGFYKINQYKKWLAKNPFCTNIGLATGYYKNLGKSLVVIDIDDVKHLEKMQSYFPSMLKTLTVKTKNGLHYYFWVPGNINPNTNKNNRWVNSRLTAEGMKVDILGQKRTVLSPNSFNKKIISNISIATLSEEEIKKIQSLRSQSNPINNTRNKNSSEGNAIIAEFYKGNIQRGSYHHALAHVSGYILRRNAKRIINGSYTKTNHEDFMIAEALKYLGAPVDVEEVKKNAGGMYKRFDINKFNSPTQTFDHYFQRKDPSIKNLLKDILQNKFQTIPVQPAKGRSLSWGMSLAQVKSIIEETLIQDGIDPKSINFSADLLKKFLSMFHDVKKIENDRIINGKRIRGWRWNLMLSSSMDAPNKEDKAAGTLTQPSKPINNQQIPIKTNLNHSITEKDSNMEQMIDHNDFDRETDDDDDSKEIFENHLTWLQTHGKEGKRHVQKNTILSGFEYHYYNVDDGNLLAGSTLSLPGIHYLNCDFSVANYFEEIDFSKCTFENCNLQNVNFRNSNLSRAEFKSDNPSMLIGLDLRDCNLKHTKFPESISVPKNKKGFVIKSR